MYTGAARRPITNEGHYALDDLFGAPDVGAGEQLHDWLMHSCTAGYRYRCGIDQKYSGTKTILVIWIRAEQGGLPKNKYSIQRIKILLLPHRFYCCIQVPLKWNELISFFHLRG